jgi:hypothetical protein
MSTLTLADVNRAIKALQVKKRPKAVEVLARFGVLRTPELRPDQYQGVIEMATDELAKLAGDAIISIQVSP